MPVEENNVADYVDIKALFLEVQIPYDPFYPVCRSVIISQKGRKVALPTLLSEHLFWHILKKSSYIKD